MPESADVEIEGQTVTTPTEPARRIRRLGNDVDELYVILARVETTVGGHTTRLDRIDGRLDGLDGRLDGSTGGSTGSTGRLDGIDGRFDGIDGRLDAMTGRMESMDERLDEMGRGVYTIRSQVSLLTTFTDRKLDSMNRKLTAILDRLPDANA